MTIPRIIHYCWFGGKPIPKEIINCMNTWDKLDYTIKRWDETNVDLDCSPFVRYCYDNNLYAFVSDYVRLSILYNYGGIYLDTDVEIKKNFNRFLDYDVFMGFIFPSSIGTAVVGSVAGHRIIGDLIKQYDDKVSLCDPNNDLITAYFINKYPNFKLNGKEQSPDEGICIFPKEFFECPTYKKTAGYAVHYCKGSWSPRKKNLFKTTAKIMLGRVAYAKLSHYYGLRKSKFYPRYLKDKNIID